jgi:hypothetical protein
MKHDVIIDADLVTSRLFKGSDKVETGSAESDEKIQTQPDWQSFSLNLMSHRSDKLFIRVDVELVEDHSANLSKANSTIISSAADIAR